MLDDVEDLPAIERRTAAVRSVRQVVHAIWALARAQLPLVEAAVAEASVYVDWIDEMAAAVAGAPRPRGGAGALRVVLGPERPYCGALPRQILEQLPKRGRLGLVGARLLEAAAQDRAVMRRVVFDLPAAVTHEEPEEVAEALAEAMLRHAGAEDVELLYPRGGGSELCRVVLLSGARDPVAWPPETLSPLGEVIDAAVVASITGRLAVGVAEALRSEVRARIEAGDAARRACDDRLEALGKAWAVARQEQITGELLEVVAGRQATLAGRGG